MELDPLEVVSKFVTDIASCSADVYIGIDPGTTGAIALLCDKLVVAFDIPVYRSAVKRSKALSKEEQARTGKKTRTVHGTIGEFDYDAIVAIFKQLRAVRDRVVIGLEKVPPKAGKGPLRMADVKIYAAWALWPLFLTSKRYVLEEPRPNDWKQKMGLAGKDKESARQKAIKMFPRCTDIKRKKDHNRAEAILIAAFVRSQREHTKSSHCG